MPTIIRVKDNGSLKVEGDFTIVDAEGNAYDLRGRTAVSLCRCGLSATMPFCDKAHRAAGFTSVCHAYALEPVKDPPKDTPTTTQTT
jgi:CDGSH-type Zn-finger protein